MLILEALAFASELFIYNVTPYVDSKLLQAESSFLINFIYFKSSLPSLVGSMSSFASSATNRYHY